MELDEGGLDETKTEEHSFLKALGDDIVLTQADIICKRYLAAKEKANLPPDVNINLVQTTVSEIYNECISSLILKSMGAEMEANSTPKKAPRQNSGRFRSALKEKAYKSHIVHARHRRYLVDPSISSTNSETEQVQNMLSATQMLKTLKRYSEGSEEGMASEDMNEVLLHSEEKQLNESGSSTGTVGSNKKLSKSSKITNKGVGGRKRRSLVNAAICRDISRTVDRASQSRPIVDHNVSFFRSKLSISGMSLAELTHDLGESVAALTQEEREIENSKKERIADRLLEKIQKAQEKIG
uniref:Nbl1_Borealin_N domain-containing protein n=1 Tax=Elaeophora elaphi TaxID=1147741 RepID=A0A0R3RHK7_9BILA